MRLGVGESGEGLENFLSSGDFFPHMFFPNKIPDGVPIVPFLNVFLNFIALELPNAIMLFSSFPHVPLIPHAFLGFMSFALPNVPFVVLKVPSMCTPSPIGLSCIPWFYIIYFAKC
jgi:hypothetical protein